MKMLKKIYLLFIFLFIPIKALALIEVDITRGNLNPLPIAVSPLSIDDKSKKNFENILKKENIGLEISAIVENNLRTSGIFNPLNKDAFLQAPDIANLKPRFEDWNLIKAQALITGNVRYVDEKLRVEFRLWDVLAAKEMMALAFTTVPNNWRRVGHIISDKVYERLTGEKGYFDTRIIYVAEEGPKTQRIKKLAIMDQDGFNNKFLTLGNELVLTPRFNPTSQMVTYLSYFKNLPRVYLLDIETGTQEVVGDFPGMTFAPRFSPDGKKIIMSFAKDGRSDIYTMDLENRLVEKITDHPSIDTSPSYSPDSKYIAFNSDRSGYQQIYVMNSDGSNVKRISFGKGLLLYIPCVPGKILKLRAALSSSLTAIIGCAGLCTAIIRAANPERVIATIFVIGNARHSMLIACPITSGIASPTSGDSSFNLFCTNSSEDRAILFIKSTDSIG